MTRLTCITAGLAALVALACTPAAAERGHWSVFYQHIHVDGFEAEDGRRDIGTTDTHALYFDLSWALNDRVTLSAGIPLIRKRYEGPVAHRPDLLDPPSNDEFVDDGDWHTEWQDLHLAVHWHAHHGPVSVSPFLALGVPSNDYPFFGHAAVGQRLWRVELGAEVTWLPLLHDVYVRAAPAYVFVEETLGESIDHWKLDAEVGWLVSRDLTARLFVIAKQGDGLDFPSAFPPPRTNERWRQHDRLVKHNYANAGLALDVHFGGPWSFSGSAMTMLWAEQVHIMEYAVSVGVSRSF